MAGQQDNTITLTAGEAIGAAFLRAKVTSTGNAWLADAVDGGIGTFQKNYSANDKCAIRLDVIGSSKMVANAAIAAGAKVYAANSGKIAPSGTKVVGTAIEAATANNDVIEVIPHPGVNQSSSSSSSSSSST